MRYGFEVELLGRVAIEARSSFSRAAALVTGEAAQIDVYRFTHRLLMLNLARGLRVFADTEIARYENHQNGVVLQTAGGRRIQARHVVFATGYDAAHILKRGVVQLSSTYVAISKPIERFDGWPDTCLIWETARPYLYLRTTDDGRALIGGQDEPFADPAWRDSLLPEKTALLVGLFRAMFPRIPFEVETSYAGTFGKTSDGLAYIGAVPEFPHGYFALGFGGNGITFSIVAADIVRDSIRGIGNADAPIFSFDRPSR
jgi:glycine/D-amino acid oxidase-like deaminating enzyme